MRERLKNNFGLKVLSLLFAIVLWLLVVNIDDPIGEVTFRNIPVKVLHEEIFTSKSSTYTIVDDKDTVNVTVSARRKVLSEIKPSDIIVTADIKDRVTNSLTEATLPTEVTIQGFEGEYQSAYTTPKNIDIEIEASTNKKFPISVTTIGMPRDGNVIGSMTANPEFITLAGGESQINRVKKVVAKANVSGISSSGQVDAELILYDENEKVIDQALFDSNLGKEGVKVDIEVLKTKEVPLRFDMSDINTASGYTLGNIFYEPKKILVSGEESVLKELDIIDIPSGALKLNDISETTEVKVDVSKYLPKKVKLVDDTAGTIIVTVSVERYGTKAFSIPGNNVILENTLAGLKANIGTVENIEIQVKGSRAALEKLTEAPKVYVDLGKYTTAGTITVPLQAELPPGCTLVGNVTVPVVLTGEQK